MPDVFDVLRQDHSEVKTMLAQLQEAADEEQRGRLATDLVIAESGHEAAEEMHFWPTVRRLVDGGDDLADAALNQEAAGKQILDRLDKATAGTAEFDDLVASFAEAGTAHMTFEEEVVWPKLQPLLDPTSAADLGAAIERAEATGPTRPHPNAPDNPAGLKTAGPAVAAADRIRDKTTGRT